MKIEDDIEHGVGAVGDDVDWAEAELAEFTSTHDKLHTYLLAVIAIMLFVLIVMLARVA